MVRCQICNEKFEVITNTHVQSRHQITLNEYIDRFGSDGCGFSINPVKLPKDDPRYKKWKNSLKGRETWNKGETKETHPSVKKISKTFKEKEIYNFSKVKPQKLKIEDYPEIPNNGNKAELIGCILGDGYIYQHERVQSLNIAGNTKSEDFLERYKKIIEELFKKEASFFEAKNRQCTYIVLYQKFISERLSIPQGAKSETNFSVPGWIKENKNYLIRYLRGLYEAEGCFSVHEPTYTYKFIFTNKNKSLLNIVENNLRKLGFHPHRTKRKVQISRKKEVYKCKNLLKFREY